VTRPSGHYAKKAIENRANDELRTQFMGACGRAKEDPHAVFHRLGINSTTTFTKFSGGGNLPWYYHYLIHQYIAYHPIPQPAKMAKASSCATPF